MIRTTVKLSEAGAEPRSPYRRKIDTEDRLDWLRAEQTTRLPRMTVLCYGLELLDRECQERSYAEVWETLRDIFGTPVADLSRLSVRPLIGQRA